MLRIFKYYSSKPMRTLISYFVFFSSFIFPTKEIFAQGGALLIQQYGTYDVENEGLRKWNYDVHTLLNRFNTTNRETQGKIGMSVGGTVRYNFKKSYGLRSGIDLHRFNYAYNSANDTSIDNLVFLSVPFTGRLYPFKRVTLEMGFVYNVLLSAKGNPPTNLEDGSISYPSGTFSNSFGVLTAVHYSLWKRFSASLQYQFQKKNNSQLQRETNALAGLMLGIHYRVLSRKIPDY